MNASIRFAPNGSGSGGGSFYGTQTKEATDTLLGYYTAAPLVAVLSTLEENVDVQWLNLSSGPYIPFEFNGKVKSANKLFYVFNLTPSNPPAAVTNLGWSTVTVFRPDGLLEVFALTWNPGTAYQFVAALTPFQVLPSGSLSPVNLPTLLDLVVTSTTVGGPNLTPSSSAPFVCSARLHAASPPRERSRRLQNYLAG